MGARPSVLALVLAVVALLGACGDEPDGGSPHAAWPAGDLFPLADGWRWTYDARRGTSRWQILMRRVGGDVRERDGVQVRYEFLYGDLDADSRDMLKSIYALPDGGPEEFYVDAFHLRIHHDPPVPLFPPTRSLDGRWTWHGTLGFGNDEREFTDTPVSLRVRGLESVTTPAGTFEALRTDESAAAVLISRWFVPDVGMVRLRAEGTWAGKPLDFDLVLTSFTPPGD